MLIRPKLFLRCLVLCITPLLLVGIFNYWNGLRTTRSAIQNDLSLGLTKVNAALSEGLTERERELAALARTEEVRSSLDSRRELNAADRNVTPPDLRIKLATLFGDQTNFVSLVIYDSSQRPLLQVVQKKTDGEADLVFYERDFPHDQPKPDERALALPKREINRSPILVNQAGPTSKLTVPIWTSESKQSLLGSIVAEQNIDALFSEAAEKWNLTTSDETIRTAPTGRMLIVLDSSGRILYHPNHALLHQRVSESMRYFMPVAQRMLAGQTGTESFVSATGAESEAAFNPFPPLSVSVSTTVSAPTALAAVRSTGLIGIGLLILFGVIAAFVLAHYWQRQRRGIDRVKKGVEAIAKGKLDHRIEVQSSVDMRPLADNVNLLTTQLREQLSREAEAEQFQSFVRLSAMLTHDLKNSIEALSLIVGNMEKHFHNENFRVDAMRSLNIATQNLRTLVDRLSNPITTLSGEHKRPEPIDLIPLLRRAIAITAEPVRGTHKIENRLPETLFALVDAERISKVIDNLVLNALESMAHVGGTITIEAGKIGDGQVFFSVTDTGKGMSRDFIEKRLYHPFATTKRRGVGLGLYTCREVVRANGGSIDVDSTEGAGTTFRVVLPSAETKQSD